MDRVAQDWTRNILKAAAIILAVLLGTYLLLVGARRLRPGCFGFVATCPGSPDPSRAAADLERCVSEQYAAACPFALRLPWLFVWLLYCAGVVGLVMKREIKERFSPPSAE